MVELKVVPWVDLTAAEMGARRVVVRVWKKAETMAAAMVGRMGDGMAWWSVETSVAHSVEKRVAAKAGKWAGV